MRTQLYTPLLRFTDAVKPASVNRGPRLLLANGWMDQDTTWHLPLGQGNIVLDGDPAPLPQTGALHRPLFGLCLLWPNGRPSQQLLSSCLIASIAAINFYSARNARIASTVIATAIPSVRLSVCLSVRLSVRHTPVLCQNDGT